MLSAAILAVSLSSAPAPAAGEPQIDWYQGEVQAAFDLARKDKKPLFLYWGAVWCPPCNQIKKTIFTRREFIEKSRLFLPVYLDGDTERAQIWGEKLGASGYPTMIVYSPEGKEILRLPTGLQLEEFNAVLDQALGAMEPIASRLEAALGASDPAAVPDASWRVLSYYSWDQDEALKLSTAQQEEKFRALEARVPARLKREKSRLFFLWLGAALERAEEKPEEGKKAFALSEAERKAARERVLEVLASPELTVANLQVLELASAEIVKGLEPEKGPGRTALVAAWEKAMERVEKSESLSIDERLTAVVPALELHSLEAGKDAPVPPALQERVRKLAAWADQSARDAYTRQAAMSTAASVLDDAGLKDEARKLLLAELDKSTSPHYFMSSLASLAREAGNKDEAVSWLRRAYESSRGPATRFQWGTNYLIGLIDITPEAAQAIHDESARVLKELLGHDDAFAGRNQARIKRLSSKYAAWNKEGAHKTEVAALSASLKPACANLSDKSEEAGQSMRGRCSAFFDGLGGNK